MIFRSYKTEYDLSIDNFVGIIKSHSKEIRNEVLARSHLKLLEELVEMETGKD